MNKRNLKAEEKLLKSLEHIIDDALETMTVAQAKDALARTGEIVDRVLQRKSEGDSDHIIVNRVAYPGGKRGTD